MSKPISVVLLILVNSAGILPAATPALVSYQGRLTDNVGDPVSDGNYSVEFTIYDAPAAGTSLWTETQNVTTSGGLFSVELGTVNPLSDGIFDDAARYLGIKVEADPEISPRTQLTTSPYAYRISTVDGSTGGAITGDVTVTSNSGGNAFEVSQTGFGRGGFFQVANGSNSEAAVQGTHVGPGPGGSFFSDGGGVGIQASAAFGTAAEFTGDVHTFGDEVIYDGADSILHVDASLAMLRTFGSDGLEQSRLWGNTFGELRLRDNADNDVTAALAANSNIGGSLLLMDEDGTTNLSLFGGNTGDAAAILPQASINSLETSNEPGVSNRIELAQVILSGSPDTLVTRTITVPEEGYVLVMGSLNFNFVHTTGIQSYGNISLEDNFGGDYTVSARVGTGSASANWEMPTTIQGIFDVDAGANQYHLIVEEQSGALTASNAQLTLIYFPTAYGVVTSNKSEASVDIGLKGDAEISESQSFSEQRIAAELVTMRQQIEALKAQLDAQAQNE